MALIPQLAIGTTEKIMNAVTKRVLKYPGYALATDTNLMYFIHADGTAKPITGDNPQYVQPVTAFPETGETGVLYVKNGIVYTWDGEQYVPQYVDNSEQFIELSDEIDALRDETVANADLEQKVKDLIIGDESEEGGSSVATMVSEAIDTRVNAIIEEKLPNAELTDIDNMFA